jgi:hypothetical protein
MVNALEVGATVAGVWVVLAVVAFGVAVLGARECPRVAPMEGARRVSALDGSLTKRTEERIER